MSITSSLDNHTILAADIGGTKTLVALVSGNNVIEARTLPTARSSTPENWLSDIHDIAKAWSGQFCAIGVTVTGQVQDGLWTDVNSRTLKLSEPFNLAERLLQFGLPFEILNDAQAAAWGEYLYGNAAGLDLVYLTVSTGLGGGIITDGRLLKGHRGLAGHFGLVTQNLADVDGDMEPFENVVSGPWIAREAERITGIKSSTTAVFEAARSGTPWAKTIIQTSAARVARLCCDISFSIDPEKIVIGGGVGLAEGYLPLVQLELSKLIPGHKIEILTSALRENAGIVGIAAYAAQSLKNNGGI